MLAKLRSRLVLYAVLLTWIVGGIVAVAAYLQMNRGIGREARARVEAAVRAGMRLIEDGAFLDEGERLQIPASAADRPAWLEALVERAIDDGAARGFALVDGQGLSVVEVLRGADHSLSGWQHPLRGANGVPDALRSLLLSPEDRQAVAPTITVFEGPKRIATNVLKADGQRAVGTFVSDEVRRVVLQEGEVFSGRAFVVGRWTITCYLPIRSPDGPVIGMLYAGLDEGPYVDEGRRNRSMFLVVILAITALISLGAFGIARRLARPIDALTESSTAVAGGDYRKVGKISGPEEIRLLARAFDTMVDRVLTRTNQLQVSRERAEQSLADYLEVLTFIAHELKSPVAGSLTTLDVIEGGFSGEVPDAMKPRLAALRRYLHRGLEIALQFNHLSQLETPGFAIENLAETDLRTGLVDVAVEDIADEAQRRGTEIAVEGHGSACIDPTLMRIVLNNFVGNAVKYGEDGGAVRVEISAPEDGVVRIGVWNDGVGIPDDQRGQLFEKFFRVRDPKLKGRKGSGVGLYLSRRIVELHHGRVGVEGEYGSWVRFWLEVPVTPATPSAP